MIDIAVVSVIIYSLLITLCHYVRIKRIPKLDKPSIHEQFKQMKLIGFVKEHDNMDISIPFESMMDSEELESLDRNRIIKYLEKGKIITGYMCHFQDLQSKNQGEPWGYLTDGKFIWPTYYPYYLKKYKSFQIDRNLIYELLKNGFDMDCKQEYASLFEEELIQILEPR